MMDAIKQQTGHAQVNGARLSYEMAGAGNPLVLIHAGVTDRRLWDNQMQVLAQHNRVIRYDTRGYGDSTAGDDDYSRSEDLYGLLQALNIEQAILLGCSQGVTTALDFALEHPDMTSGLILVSAVPNGYNFEGEPPQKLLQFASAYQQRDLDQAAELATQIWFDGPQRRPDQTDPAIRSWVHDMMRDIVAGAIDVTGEKFSSHSTLDQLGNIKVPTLIISGDKDDPSILEAGEYLATTIPHAEKIVIPNAAHLPSIEKPAAFNQAVLDFLQRQF
jgi:3-oxoadipate enol-lactonase